MSTIGLLTNLSMRNMRKSGGRDRSISILSALFLLGTILSVTGSQLGEIVRICLAMVRGYWWSVMFARRSISRMADVY